MKKTALFESHKALGVRFISFAGWQMPFSYRGPALEHHQVRQTGGLFDVSHMGQIRVCGRDSLLFLEKLLPSDLKSLDTGQACYSVLCSHQGTLIDDLIVYACSKGESYLLCVNAATKEKDLEWIQSQKHQEKPDIRDESEKWALIAVQGPQSFNLCEKVFPSVSFQAIPKFHFVEGEGDFLFSRTGYTGEEGFEIYIPWNQSLSIWEKLLEEGKKFSIEAIGLGARDTLRLEMGYLLSGQDFDETKSPLQAGLSWLIKSKADYIGRQALLKQKEEGLPSQLRGFTMEEPSPVPRKGFPLYSKEGKLAGHVTSGAKSPSLDKMIALAYVQGKGEELYLESRGVKVKAKPASIPFLKKADSY